MIMLPVLATMAAAGVGGWLATRFDGITLSGWALAIGPLLTGAMVLVIAVPSGPLIWTLVLTLTLTALALIDAATHQLPDVLSVSLIGLGLAQVVLTGDPVWGRLTAAVLLVAFGLLSDRLAPQGAVGAGDFLLLAGAVSWLGFAPLLELAMLAALLLWAHFLLLIGLRRCGMVRGTGVPLAPALALAWFALWLAGP